MLNLRIEPEIKGLTSCCDCAILSVHHSCLQRCFVEISKSCWAVPFAEGCLNKAALLDAAAGSSHRFESGQRRIGSGGRTARESREALPPPKPRVPAPGIDIGAAGHNPAPKTTERPSALRDRMWQMLREVR